MGRLNAMNDRDVVRQAYLHVWDPGTDTGRLLNVLAVRESTDEASLERTTRLSAARVEQALATLKSEDLITRAGSQDAARWSLCPLDQTDSRLDRLEQDVRRARQAHHDVAMQYWLNRRSGSNRYHGLEVVRDVQRSHDLYRQILSSATDQVRGFDRPPYATSQNLEQLQALNAAQQASMVSGVRYRVVYYDGVLRDDPEIAASTLRNIERGEEARMLRGLPMKILIADDEMAMIPLDPAGGGERADLIVHPSGLLDALIETFELLWASATPISGPASAEGDVLSEEQRGILLLLAGGETDDAIARRLGTSRRSVTRHCAVIYERLGVRTRFQAGIRAQELGLVGSPAGTAP